MPEIDGDALRHARRARGLSLDGLAAVVGGGITRQQLIDYEAGTRCPDPPRLAALAAALRVPPERLAGIEPCWASLADLRHWAGLTAEQAAARHFEFSRWSLLRAEKTGRLPWFASREGFVADAVTAYGRPYGIVLGALRRTEQRALVSTFLRPPPYFLLPPAPQALHRCRVRAAERGAADVDKRLLLGPVDVADVAEFARRRITAAAGSGAALARRVLGL